MATSTTETYTLPYTTLFRSQDEICRSHRGTSSLANDRLVLFLREAETAHRIQYSRSEEHTSELQSHVNLVCRLLLEKKKETSIPITKIHTNHGVKHPITHSP